MTPDTPTTATAAMRELLAKHPLPWSLSESGVCRDAIGVFILLNEVPISFIVAAVNATGADRDTEIKAWQADCVKLAQVTAERDELRSALAAAREQHGTLLKRIKDLVKPLAEMAGRDFGDYWLDNKLQLGEVCSMIDAAALSPSQPTPDAGECDPNKLCDPEWIGSELDPHERRCRKCGIVRAAGGGGD